MGYGLKLTFFKKAPGGNYMYCEHLTVYFLVARWHVLVSKKYLKSVFSYTFVKHTVLDELLCSNVKKCL